MEKNSYRPRFTLILLLALVVGQIVTFNYLKNEFNKQLNQCYEAINTGTIIQGALVNLLVKKNVIERDELVKEAGTLTTNLGALMEKLQKEMKEREGNKQLPETEQQ